MADTKTSKPRGPNKPKPVYIVTRGNADDIVAATTKAADALGYMNAGGVTVVTKTLDAATPASSA